MSALVSLAAACVLAAAALAGAAFPAGRVALGQVLPILAFLCFVAGVAFRVLLWARAPVPFRIPTTCGQQKSLPWIRANAVDNPSSGIGTIARLALEVLFFRSLFRNTQSELRPDGRLVYTPSPWLWAGALAFHGALCVILLRHLRFFLNPVPAPLIALQSADGFFQVALPALYASTFVFLGGMCFLLGRRLVSASVRYLSLPQDYFPLFLFLGIVATGLWVHFFEQSTAAPAKELALGLANLSFARPPADLPAVFFAHLLLASVLLAWIPGSKIMHMAGVFLSPTRNLANNSRAVRHVNPWNPDVEVHTYAEYEDEFRENMKGAGIPVEKETK